MSPDYAIVEIGRAIAKLPSEQRSGPQRALMALARRRFGTFMDAINSSGLTRIHEWKDMDKGEYRVKLQTDLGMAEGEDHGKQ